MSDVETFPAEAEEAALKSMAAGLVEGFALVDEQGRFVWVNDFGAQVLGEPASGLAGQDSPFRAGHPVASATGANGGAEAASSVETAVAHTRHGDLELEYRVVRASARSCAVSFRNATGVRRLAAIARAASSVANAGSLSITLNALAEAVHAAGGLAAVQVVTLHDDQPQLRIVGRAGFADGDDYTERLEACRQLGADMQMLQAVREGRPVVTRHRKASVMADARWAPMHDFFGPVDWDSFVAVPLVVRGKTVGMLVVFYPTGRHPDARSLGFLNAIADQAAMAVDHASLLTDSKHRARRNERQRIARDLHDAVVQQVFSMRLQARALHDYCVSADTEPPLDAQRVTAGVAQLMALSQHALADLRDLIFELRPEDITEHGLAEAIELHADAIRSRSGILVEVDSPPTPLELESEAQEDLYRIVQEALHNVVKHAEATTATVKIATERPESSHVVVEVRDDGRGMQHTASSRGRIGLSSMRERAAKWGGDLQIDSARGRGVCVRVALPLARSDGASSAESEEIG
ncbi:MAG: GAF domain-containing sensor histidine kinase [Nocardioidaceae bacterium]